MSGREQMTRTRSLYRLSLIFSALLTGARLSKGIDPSASPTIFPFPSPDASSVRQSQTGIVDKVRSGEHTESAQAEPEGTHSRLDFWGAIASIFGIPLALGGLYYAITEARKARSASQAAETAVNSFRNDLNLLTSVADFTRALSIAEAIKGLVQHGPPYLLPDRLSEMRHLLIAIRGTTTDLPAEQSIFLQNAIVNLNRLEGDIGESNIARIDFTISPEMFRAMIADADALHEVLTNLKNRLGKHETP